MPNLTSVGVTAGVPTSGTGTVSTIDNMVTLFPVLAAATATGNAIDFNLKSGGNANGQAAMAGSAPVAIASDQSTLPVNSKVLATTNGLTSSRVKAAATTNATSLKASAGNIASIDVFNVAAYSVFLQLYNKASAPTVGTDVPVWTIPIAAGTGFSRSFLPGKFFSTGIAYAITKLQADTDTTAVVANDLTGSIDWI